MVISITCDIPNGRQFVENPSAKELLEMFDALTIHDPVRYGMRVTRETGFLMVASVLEHSDRVLMRYVGTEGKYVLVSENLAQVPTDKMYVETMTDTLNDDWGYLFYTVEKNVARSVIQRYFRKGLPVDLPGATKLHCEMVKETRNDLFSIKLNLFVDFG